MHVCMLTCLLSVDISKISLFLHRLKIQKSAQWPNNTQEIIKSEVKFYFILNLFQKSHQSSNENPFVQYK